MADDLILSQQENEVFIIEINRPDKMNALTDEMYRLLTECLKSAEANPSVKVVLLKSSGAHFCAGNDLADFLETEFNQESNVIQFLITLASLKKTVIAAVNGAAVGVGTTMLLHCDLVYACENTKFSMPFIKLGLTPEGGASQLLAQRCGPAKACEWLLTGRNILAEEALQAGLVNQVFADNQTTWQKAMDSAAQLSSRSQQVLVESKKLMKGGQVDEVIELIKKEAVVFAERLQSDEAQRAFKAFLSR